MKIYQTILMDTGFKAGKGKEDSESESTHIGLESIVVAKAWTVGPSQHPTLRRNLLRWNPIGANPQAGDGPG